MNRAAPATQQRAQKNFARSGRANRNGRISWGAYKTNRCGVVSEVMMFHVEHFRRAQKRAGYDRVSGALKLRRRGVARRSKRTV